LRAFKKYRPRLSHRSFAGDRQRVIFRRLMRRSGFVPRPSGGLRRGCNGLKHTLDSFLAVEVSIRVRGRVEGDPDE